MDVLKKGMSLMLLFVLSLSICTFSIASNSNNEEINKLIDTRKSENNSNNELNPGYGMKSLNRSPIPSFEQSLDKKYVNVTIEDGNGIDSISRKIESIDNAFQKRQVNKKNKKIQTDKFDGPKEGKSKKVTYIVTDSAKLKSTIKCIIYNKNGTYIFDTSMRVSLSYSNNNVHIILKDMGGVTADNAYIEVFDYNTSNKKSVVSASGKNIKINTNYQIEYPENSGKIVYGIYDIPLSKLTKKNGTYYVRIKTVDCNKNVGYRMAKFEVNKETSKKESTPETPTQTNPNKSTISTAFDSYMFPTENGTIDLKAKSTSKNALKYSSSNTKVATVDKNGIVTAKRHGTAKIKISQSNNSQESKTVVIRVPSISSTKQVLKPWFDAQKAQAAWMPDVPTRKFAWDPKPTIASSKNKGTCLSFIACSLQRIDFLKPGQFLAIKNSKLTSKSKSILDKNKELFEYHYVYKTRKQLGNKLKIGDLIGFTGSSQHIQVYAGVNSKGEDIYNTSGYKTKLNTTNKTRAGKVFSVIIRLKTYNVKAECINGKVSGSNQYLAKQNAVITYTPTNGKKLQSVTVDGKKIDIKKYPNKYTIKNITSNHNVKIVFN